MKKSTFMKVLGVAAGLVLSAAAAPAVVTSAGTSTSSQTAQGIMVNLNTSGDFAIADTNVYHFAITQTDLNNSSTGEDANGVAEPADAYFTNTQTGDPAVSCGGSSTNCALSNQPSPTAPAPDSSQVDGPPPNGTCHQQRCTFLDGGTLAGSTYTQSMTNVAGLNGHGSWKFTWTYTIAPTCPSDAASAGFCTQDGSGVVTVSPFTAWYLYSSQGSSTAPITINADIAGESVVVSSKWPCPSSGQTGPPTFCGKFSFSLSDSTTSNRVENLALTVTDSSNNIVESATPGSTVNYPVDFDYTTNAGSNGSTKYLTPGTNDDMSILNNDEFAGNDNGGADGSAAALATMDATIVDLGPGDYSVTLTGTVKGNNGLANITFSVTNQVHIITPGCGSTS